MLSDEHRQRTLLHLRQKITSLARVAVVSSTSTAVAKARMDVGNAMEMTLNDIVDHFDNSKAFTDWLKAAKIIEDITKLRMANAKETGKLVSREAVRIGVFDPINSALKNLQTDGAQTIVTRVATMLAAGLGHEEIVQKVSDYMGTFITASKERAKNALMKI